MCSAWIKGDDSTKKVNPVNEPWFVMVVGSFLLVSETKFDYLNNPRLVHSEWNFTVPSNPGHPGQCSRRDLRRPYGSQSILRDPGCEFSGPALGYNKPIGKRALTQNRWPDLLDPFPTLFDSPIRLVLREARNEQVSGSLVGPRSESPVGRGIGVHLPR